MRPETGDKRQESQGIGRRFRSIKAWQRADDLVARVYEATRAFPNEERYGLTSQMRRSAVSVAANIVEGASRRSRQEYLQFLFVAKASLNELSYYVCLARRLAYVMEPPFNELNELCEETARTLYGLIQSVSKETANKVSHV